MRANAGFCIGIVKATGTKCNKRAKYGKYCGIHDPARKDNKKANESNVKRILANLRIRLEDRYNIDFHDIDVEDLPKKVDLKDTTRVITEIVMRFLNELATDHKFRDLYSYMRADSLAPQFPRLVWQKISNYLTKTDRDSLAMTCRKMYFLNIQDKIWYYRHPLKNRMLSPQIFHMPIYRLVSMPVMNNLEKVLETLGKPTVEKLMDEYIAEHGNFKSEKKLKQVIGWMIRYSTENILSKVLEEEREDIEESIPGAGFFSDIEYPGGLPREALQKGMSSVIDMKTRLGAKLSTYVSFVDDIEGAPKPPDYLLFAKQSSNEGQCETWILFHCPKRFNHARVHAKALSSFVGFDGNNIISLMKWNL